MAWPSAAIRAIIAATASRWCWRWWAPAAEGAGHAAAATARAGPGLAEVAGPGRRRSAEEARQGPGAGGPPQGPLSQGQPLRDHHGGRAGPAAGALRLAGREIQGGPG